MKKVTLLVVMLATAGCGAGVRDSASQGASRPPASLTATPEASATAAVPVQRLRLTLDDDGRTFSIKTRSNVTLSLPDDDRWTAPRGEGADVIVSEELSDAPTGTRVWIVRPTETGRATLRTTAAGGRTFTVTLEIYA